MVQISFLFKIVATEKNYVHALQMITEKFIRVVENGIMSSELMATIFMNIEVRHHFIY